MNNVYGDIENNKIVSNNFTNFAKKVKSNEILFENYSNIRIYGPYVYEKVYNIDNIPDVIFGDNNIINVRFLRLVK
jgi:hypothetical protein